MNYLTLTCKEKPLFALKWKNKKLDFFEKVVQKS
jgi:hypothetical protein